MISMILMTSTFDTYDTGDTCHKLSHSIHLRIVQICYSLTLFFTLCWHEAFHCTGNVVYEIPKSHATIYIRMQGV